MTPCGNGTLSWCLIPFCLGSALSQVLMPALLLIHQLCPVNSESATVHYYSCSSPYRITNQGRQQFISTRNQPLESQSPVMGQKKQQQKQCKLASSCWRDAKLPPASRGSWVDIMRNSKSMQKKKRSKITAFHHNAYSKIQNVGQGDAQYLRKYQSVTKRQEPPCLTGHWQLSFWIHLGLLCEGFHDLIMTREEGSPCKWQENEAFIQFIRVKMILYFLFFCT